MHSIKDLSVFLCVSQSKNFTEAATILGMTSSAVGKVITKIEHEYKTILFHRNTRNVSLTEDGEMLLKHTINIMSEINLAKINLTPKNKSYTGKIKIGMPNINELFEDLLISFLIKYPGIEVEAHFDDDKVNIIKEGFDAVIRFGKISDSRLFSKKIGELKMGVFHSSQYKTTLNDDLNTFLLYKYPSSGKIEYWHGYDNLDMNNIKNKHIFNSISMILKLCIESVGIAFLPEAICDNYINSGELVRFKNTQSTVRDVSIVWSNNKDSGTNVRAFIDHFNANFMK
ncbi:LysR family transcriptional regulator [Orbus wheelerorum]|uniref:LysR family transcriptional regulator n=1 Tax=Orbus wheelerorum TaxID=3074111 RepID=UPI00370D7DB1